MIEKVKLFRLQIDGLGQLVKELKPIKEFEPVYKDHETSVVGNTYKTAGNVVLFEMNSNEIKESYKSLMLGKAWLGKVLGSLGKESPYPKDGTRKDIKDIEPTAERDEMMKNNLPVFGGSVTHLLPEGKEWKDLNHIERVDWIREDIKIIIEGINELHEIHDTIDSDNVYTHLSEARFHLGFELERIREQSK